eukprot:9482219-Pyramimonas_sp.AAC.1
MALPRGGVLGAGPQMFSHKSGAPSIAFRRMAGPTVGPTTSPFSRVRTGWRASPGAFVYNLQTNLVVSSGYD